MQVTLVVVEGQARKREVVLELPAIIGRSRGAAVTIGDSKVSRHHCELFESAGLVMVRDNNSLNGTFVDGQPVKECVVRPGARLTVGPLTFVVLYEPAEEATHELPPAAAPVAGVPAGEPDFAAWAAGDDEGDEQPAAASPDFLPPSASTPNMGPFVPNDVAEALDASTMAATPPASGPSPPAKAQEKRAAAKKSKPAKKPAKSAEPSEPPAESQTPAPVLPTAPSPAPAAESAPGEVDFGWLASNDSADAGTVHTDASDETVFDESAAAIKDEPPEAIEDEPAAAPPTKPEKKKPGKKRSWWPFGKKKAAKAKSQDADEEEPSEALSTSPSDAESAPMEHAAEDTRPPPEDEDEESALTEPSPPEDAADSSKADDEGGLDDFLKGIGK